MDQVAAAALHDQLHRQMLRAADSGRGIAVFAGMQGHFGKPLRAAVETRVLVNNQQQRRARDQADRREVGCLVALLLVERAVEHHRAAVTREQRVAVGGRPRGQTAADAARGARAVVNRQGLTQLAADDGCQLSRQRVGGRSARSAGHDPADRLIRPGLGCTRQQGKHCRQQPSEGAR